MTKKKKIDKFDKSLEKNPNVTNISIDFTEAELKQQKVIKHK